MPIEGIIAIMIMAVIHMQMTTIETMVDVTGLYGQIMEDQPVFILDFDCPFCYSAYYLDDFLFPYSARGHVPALVYSAVYIPTQSMETRKRSLTCHLIHLSKINLLAIAFINAKGGAG